jgi:hypothetical protein
MSSSLPRTGSQIIDASVEAAAARTAVVAGARQEAAPDPLAASNDAFLLVRRSRDAIGSFADPKPFASAAGAEFAWANDYIADNEVWSTRGIVAASFVHYGQVLRDDPYIDTLTLAPYVNFDRVSNSTRITSDVDNLTYGGVFEAGFANVFGATQFLDISGEVVTSFAGESKNWSIDLEWQPVGGRNPEGGNTIFAYLGAPHPFGRYFVITASPSLQTEYVAELGEVSTQPIFAEHNEAFHAGPAMTLALDGVKIDPVPWWDPTPPLRDQLWLAVRLSVGPGLRAARHVLDVRAGSQGPPWAHAELSQRTAGRDRSGRQPRQYRFVGELLGGEGRVN